ncbi:MAG TPA: MDR family oxidoreductase [Ornithinimicrobium sp.]|uniref:MDR family oxidoreductase n=1 Tax=Ornithinimicrobium sp. TaxID=1977084 RepID=UPI002B4A06E4|nr:MDR family oxidoreductase [Ornithinimicrobium sp.]HKJ10786.1 MDR family oxidoreductase [Ornithinimicrobium sp.]
MTDSFPALVIREGDEGPTSGVEQLTEADLPEGDVVVDVDYSSLNYKDGMALLGKGRIVRAYPMVPGIDLTGTVASSTSDRFAPGEAVILTGWGVGERYWGGYAARQSVRSEWLVGRPDGMSALTAMSIGTAGLTAMLCVQALEAGGVRPSDGPVLVTGAAGGVGSVAIALLAGRGFEVTAVTGRPEHHEYLRGLGATDFRDREEMSAQPKPLEQETWVGAVDTVGSTMLAKVLAQTRYGGTVAACGLAGGFDLPGTVMPFILRGVRLQGVDSVQAPVAAREAAWSALADELSAELLEGMTSVVSLSEVSERARQILAGQVRGRTVVEPRP